MNDKDKSSNVSHEKIVEHPQLRRDRAFALFLAPAHARRNVKPPPDPANIGPAVFTKLSPKMSRETGSEGGIGSNPIAPTNTFKGLEADVRALFFGKRLRAVLRQ
jgi:hypothetical protein